MRARVNPVSVESHSAEEISAAVLCSCGLAGDMAGLVASYAVCYPFPFGVPLVSTSVLLPESAFRSDRGIFRGAQVDDGDDDDDDEAVSNTDDALSLQERDDAEVEAHSKLKALLLEPAGGLDDAPLEPTAAALALAPAPKLREAPQFLKVLFKSNGGAVYGGYHHGNNFSGQRFCVDMISQRYAYDGGKTYADGSTSWSGFTVTEMKGSREENTIFDCFYRGTYRCTLQPVERGGSLTLSSGSSQIHLVLDQEEYAIQQRRLAAQNHSSSVKPEAQEANTSAVSVANGSGRVCTVCKQTKGQKSFSKSMWRKKRDWEVKCKRCVDSD